MTVDQERHARNDVARGAGNALSSAPEWGGTRSILIGDHIDTLRNASAVDHAAWQACLDAVFCDVATALRASRRTTFYPIAVPNSRRHWKETP